MRKPGWASYMLLAPSLAIVLGLGIFPLIFSVRTALLSYNLINPGLTEYVGLANFREFLFSGFSQFWPSLRITVTYTVVVTLVELVLGLALAVFTLNTRAKTLFRSMLILPLGVSPIIAGLTWRYLLDFDYGAANWFLSLFGVQKISWLTNSFNALLSVMLVDVWQWTPFMFLILLSGLLALPTEPMESALIDGASYWQRFVYITLPLLRPLIMVAVLLRSIDAFRVFDHIYVLTSGGPAAATEVLSMLVYKTGFKFFNIGDAAALSWLMLLIIVPVSLNLVRVMRKGEA